MIKGFLISVLSLSALYCASQEAGASISEKETGSLDSIYYITDLVHIIKENSRVVLNWRIADSTLTDFFSIERSCNSKDFEVVAVLKLAQLSKWFEWVDESPAKGKNVYRIRCSAKDNRQYYSKPLHVQIAGDISFKFYPNPVDNILIIRSENPLDIQIIDAAGKMRLSQANLQGLQTINVSTLEKGIYILRLNNRLANTIVQERLIKN
ncbi:MAG: T9SS type A sorting domain-containing protein [Chitinophagaceae bacterium]|nr:MAG: T9SS type A sorting domain-containing protein [Chitinophagaceae bacterium]